MVKKISVFFSAELRKQLKSDAILHKGGAVGTVFDLIKQISAGAVSSVGMISMLPTAPEKVRLYLSDDLPVTRRLEFHILRRTYGRHLTPSNPIVLCLKVDLYDGKSKIPFRKFEFTVSMEGKVMSARVVLPLCPY
ncbi:MAG: hypothetical protein AAB652_02415 [Patescibacteria group bacterium]